MFTGRVSRAAGLMLQSEWEHCHAAAAGTAKARSGAASGWKGRNAAMATLLKHLVLHRTKPLDMLLKLAESLMDATLSDSDYAGPDPQIPFISIYLFISICLFLYI